MPDSDYICCWVSERKELDKLGSKARLQMIWGWGKTGEWRRMVIKLQGHTPDGGTSDESGRKLQCCRLKHLLLNLKPAVSTRPAGQQDPRTYLSLLLQHWEQMCSATPGTLPGCLGSELRSPYLRGKHFTHWVICPAMLLFLRNEKL